MYLGVVRIYFQADKHKRNIKGIYVYIHALWRFAGGGGIAITEEMNLRLLLTYAMLTAFN